MRQQTQNRHRFPGYLFAARPLIEGAGLHVVLNFRSDGVAQALGVALGPAEAATEKQLVAAERNALGALAQVQGTLANYDGTSTFSREMEAALRDRLRTTFDTTLPRFDVLAEALEPLTSVGVIVVLEDSRSVDQTIRTGSDTASDRAARITRAKAVVVRRNAAAPSRQ